MLGQIKTGNILFLDIETVPQCHKYDDLPESFRQLWEKKSSRFRNADESAADVYHRAGIYAEFGKIICISVGIVFLRKNERILRIKSFYGDNEKVILKDFKNALQQYSQKKDILLCAHNGKEFDFPYIARRMLVNRIKLPEELDIAGKKPWEIAHLDTMELWKFGDYKHYTSLELLTAIFNIPSPKEDIDGSMIAETYYIKNDLQKIVEYCQRDVIAVCQLLLKYKGDDLINEKNIDIIHP